MNDKSYGRFNGPAKHVAKKPKGPVRLFLELWWENFWNMIPLNVVYSFLHMLLIPGGFAAVGMTNVTRNLTRDKHSFGLSDFFETAKKNWKQALAAGLINLVVTAVLLFGTFFYYVMNGAWFLKLGMGVCMAGLAVLSGMKYYLWLLIIMFDLPLRKVYRNSFYFVFLNWKNNLIIGGISLAIYGLLALAFFYLPWNISVTLGMLLMVMFYPGFKQLLVQYLVFPSVKKYMIDPYYEEHPEEDIEMRKDLHVITEE